MAQLSIADAAATLAGRILDAFHGDEFTGLADHVDSCADQVVALGAVRLVGADVFAPHLLLSRPLAGRDVAVVADSFAYFPAVGEPDTHERRVTAWRDWATATVLTRLAGTGPDEAVVFAPPPDTASAVLGPADAWQQWSVHVAQLSPLALPEVGGPVVEAVGREGKALARGAVRAVLRRDYVNAARLARWVALLSHSGTRLPLDPVLLVEQIRLHGGTGPRLLLDLAVARHQLGIEPA
ncbi:hypothetical protein ALI22I_20975 [Saccharothrix sp. ALI-22-I]|nr:hypothetical protein ALI22I_20975 [Saccharothrix sp. ALI-22-I]